MKLESKIKEDEVAADMSVGKPRIHHRPVIELFRNTALVTSTIVLGGCAAVDSLPMVDVRAPQRAKIEKKNFEGKVSHHGPFEGQKGLEEAIDNRVEGVLQHRTPLSPEEIELYQIILSDEDLEPLVIPENKQPICYEHFLAHFIRHTRDPRSWIHLEFVPDPPISDMSDTKTLSEEDESIFQQIQLYYLRSWKF